MTDPLAGTLEKLVAEMRSHESCSDSVSSSSPHCCVIDRWADQLDAALTALEDELAPRRR